MKSLLLLLLLPALLFVSCKKDRDHPGLIKVYLHGCSPMLPYPNAVICFDSLVSDSRCPRESVCIWEGEAIARFTLKVNGQERSVTLSTNGFSQPADTLLLGYRIRFADLTPYPGDAPTALKAWVEVMR
jgi:hypothetical protein